MQIDEKKPNILIPNIPESKLKELENIINPILKGLNIKTEIMSAPISMTQILKQYEDLYAEMRRIGNQLSALKGTGLQVGTENMEKILKLNVQHLTGAVKVIKKELNEKIDKIIKQVEIKKVISKRFTVETPEELLLRMEHNIKTKLKVGGTQTPKVLAVLALSKEPRSTKELAKEVYGKVTDITRGYIGRLLNPFDGKLITAKRRKDRAMEYSWKNKKILKEIID